MAADKNCIPINKNENHFSKNTVRIKSKNISFERLFKAQDNLKTFFSFVRIFAPKIPVEIFAHLISKLLCNIQQSLFGFGCPRRKKCFSGTTTSFRSRETRTFKLANQVSFL